MAAQTANDCSPAAKAINVQVTGVRRPKIGSSWRSRAAEQPPAATPNTRYLDCNTRQGPRGAPDGGADASPGSAEPGAAFGSFRGILPQVLEPRRAGPAYGAFAVLLPDGVQLEVEFSKQRQVLVEKVVLPGSRRQVAEFHPHQP